MFGAVACSFPSVNQGGNKVEGDFSYETYDSETYDDYSYNKNLFQ